MKNNWSGFNPFIDFHLPRPGPGTVSFRIIRVSEATMPADLIERIMNKESVKGVENMINNQAIDTHKVLVELSVIPLNGNHHTNDEIPFALDMLKNADLSYEQAHNTICVEGDWNKISEFIYSCYDRVQSQFPQGFLKVSIR